MEDPPRPPPAVTSANLNIANPQRRTTGDDHVLSHQYATGAQETKDAVTTTTTAIPPPAPVAPRVQHKWLLWIVFVLRCISIILILLILICLIYGSSRGRHYIGAYIFSALILAYTIFSQWMNSRLLFPRGGGGRVPYPPRRIHVAWAGFVEVLVVGLAVAAVFFRFGFDAGTHPEECNGYWTNVEPGSYERMQAKLSRFVCRYESVWAFSMFGVALVHFVVMVLTFVMACVTRKVVVHPDVVLVGQQPRSGRYV